MILIILLTFLLIILSFLKIRESFKDKQISKIIINKQLSIPGAKIINNENTESLINDLYGDNSIKRNTDGHKINPVLNSKGTIDINIKNGEQSVIYFDNTMLTAQDIRNMKAFSKYPSFYIDGIKYLPKSTYEQSTKGSWNCANSDYTQQEKETLNEARKDEILYKKTEEEICNKKSTDKTKYQYNKDYIEAGVSENTFPGCDGCSCCKMITPAIQNIYDKMCFGDPNSDGICIDGDDLKLLTGQNMINLENESDKKCLVDKKETLLASFANDDSDINYLTNGNCQDDSSWFQLWPSDIINLKKTIVE